MKYPIVKPYLPPLDKYQHYVAGIFERNYLTNNGPLLQLLEQRLAEYLGVKHLLLVANGTLALNVAFAALNVKGKAVTTPFSFAATASALCWQNIEPIFIDIDAQSLNMDINKLDDSTASLASAILPVHVFGNPCQVNDISKVAENFNLKVIYDAAHAFTSTLSEQSLLTFGDAATVSFHATKLFHSIEGGAIIFKDRQPYEKAKQLINFGFNQNNIPEYIGINAKMSEFHAAMGLAVLDDIDFIANKRKELVAYYQQQLTSVETITLQHWHDKSEPSGAYMPIILNNENLLIKVVVALKEQGIQVRRYFHPSLSQMKIYGENGNTPIANDISTRILCLPLYTDLAFADIKFICKHLIAALS